MALKSSNPKRHPSAGPRLARALARRVSHPEGASQADLLEALMAGPVLIGLREMPLAFEPARGEEAIVQLVTEPVPLADGDEERVVCGFADTRSLADLAPTAVPLAVDPAALLEWIAASALAGLLLDPRGARVLVSQADACRMLGLPVRSARRRSTSVDAGTETAAGEALERLLTRAPGARTTFREPRTGKSVSFERTEDGLRMALAAAALAPDELERAGLLLEGLAGGLEGLPDLPDDKDEDLPAASADPVALFSGDTERPVRAAMKVFGWVYGFLPGFALEIEET